MHDERADVLFQIGAPLRAGDGHDVAPLREQPRERKLRRLTTLLRRDLFDPFDEAQVMREVLALEARELSAAIMLRQIGRLPELARQEAAPQRTVGDEP